MTVMAAVTLGGLFTGCSSDADLSGGNTAEFNILKNYEDAFITRFGQPHENQTWGFGSNTAASTRALTRASDFLKSKFTLPEFRSKSAITKPDTPTFYTTLDQVTAAGIPYAGSIDRNSEWAGINAAYLDENSNNIRSDRSQGRTYYISGDVKYWNGFSNGDVTLVVLENSTLHLGCASYNLRIYLAPGATLDVTKTYSSSEDWSKANESNGYQPEVTITESDWNGQWTFEKSDALLYLSEGSNVIGGNFKFFDGAKILNNGGTITAANVDVDKNTTLWNEGTVSVSNKLQGVNENAFIYNAVGKTISAASLELINNSDLLVNDGTVTITNGIALQNSGAEIVNNADMSCGSFSQAAGAKMYNVGNMTMTGLTHLDNSNSGWVNDGQWTCGSFEVLGNDKGAGNNFNNCRLTVNGEFYLNREAFILDSDAGVVCESFKIDDTSGFYLGNKSVLKINGTLTTEIVNPEYGFFAYGSEYAVVQANGIETTTNDPQSINYYGNLLVAINPHLSAEYYTAESSVKFTKDGQNIATIPSSTCSPGYEGTTPPPSDPGDFICRVIAEDLTVDQNTDFDFNDVVFDVYSKGVIRIRACGGTLPLRVDGQEVHGLFGKETGDMINTGWNGVSIDYENTYRDIKYSGGSIANAAAANGILVEVQKQSGWIPLDAPVGEVASKIAVGNNYEWCRERQDIDSKWHLRSTGYKPFSDYVKGIVIGNEWYEMVIREAAKYQNKGNQ